MSKQVLIVHADIETVKLLQYRLEAVGYTVSKTGDGEQGLELLRSVKPDAVILGCEMPGLGGYEFLIKGKDAKVLIPATVFVLAENARMETLFSLEGVNVYLKRPWNIDALIERINAACHMAPVSAKGAKKILVVDDESEIVNLLGLRLQAAGYSVAKAENGQTALERLDTERPDLIILDVMMPVMDGFECFKRLKSDPRYASIPVIMLTARGAMRDTFEALDADAFVPKPFESAQLVEKVSFLLKKKALVLSDDTAFKERVEKLLTKREIILECVCREEDMFARLNEISYHLLVIHLPFLKRDAGGFVKEMMRLKHRQVQIIVYSDARVPGTEKGNTLIIEGIMNEWKKAGIPYFIDSRFTGDILPELIDRCLSDKTESWDQF